MRRPTAPLVLAAIAAGLYLASRTRAGQEALYAVEDAAAAALDPESVVELDPMSQDANLAAFAALTRQLESGGDYQALSRQGKRFDTEMLGSGDRFYDMSDHPALTGEFAGHRLPSGQLTTAAGGYQIVRSTWRELGGKARFGDFSPAGQDAAFFAILAEKRPGALRMVTQGRFTEALERLRGEWEAFDKVLSGAWATWPLERAQTFYTSAGGTLA